MALDISEKHAIARDFFLSVMPAKAGIQAFPELDPYAGMTNA
jgi:hypothetical protein